MSPLQQASILTIMALMMGLGFVLVGTMIGVPTASKLSIDDMGTTGDVAVVDYRLGNCTAAPFLNALNDKGIPFAICTGAEGSEIRTLYPHTAVLAKPYTPEDVFLVVNSLIASLLARA